MMVDVTYVQPTYRIEVVGGTPAIRCLLCDRVSEDRREIEQRRCARCDLLHDAVARGRQEVLTGATHECGEWWTYRRVCALCGTAASLGALRALLRRECNTWTAATDEAIGEIGDFARNLGDALGDIGLDDALDALKKFADARLEKARRGDALD